jgi:hypothetical protein
VVIARKWQIFTALAAVTLVCFAGLATARAEPSPPPVEGHSLNTLCLACHDHELILDAGADLERTVDSVDRQAFEASAHEGTACVECHSQQTTIPHDPVQPAAGLSVSAVGPCLKCHAEAHEGYLESPHGTMANFGDSRGPDCAECHGDIHYLPLVEDWTDEDRAEACADCHSGATTSFLDAAPLHRAISPGFLSIAYAAGLFLMILTAMTLAFGIIHVELEMLRWLVRRFTGKPGTETAGHGHAD